ncbi:hypothetical protein GQR58_008162 [Nymphon striatum]|nr:hypothetical protein GQR58_008162 [Nymphon striatum]
MIDDTFTKRYIYCTILSSLSPLLFSSYSSSDVINTNVTMGLGHPVDCILINSFVDIVLNGIPNFAVIIRQDNQDSSKAPYHIRLFKKFSAWYTYGVVKCDVNDDDLSLLGPGNYGVTSKHITSQLFHLSICLSITSVVPSFQYWLEYSLISSTKIPTPIFVQAEDNLLFPTLWREDGAGSATSSKKDPKEDTKMALKRTPPGRKNKGRPKTTWRRMVEKERNAAGWSSWASLAKERGRWKGFVTALYIYIYIYMCLWAQQGYIAL